MISRFARDNLLIHEFLAVQTIGGLRITDKELSNEENNF